MSRNNKKYGNNPCAITELYRSQRQQTPSKKHCFITVGATASFTTLIRAALSPTFLHALQAQNYRSLRIQYGKDGKKTFDDYLWALSEEAVEADDAAVTATNKYGLEITGFEFNRDGLSAEMVRAKGGCVVSHAGSGSILDALRVGAPLLVVPNPELMDNHQVELAEILEEQNYVVHGRLEDLADGIDKVEKLRVAMQMWPPATATGKSGGLVKVVREEMGWLD